MKCSHPSTLYFAMGVDEIPSNTYEQVKSTPITSELAITDNSVFLGGNPTIDEIVKFTDFESLQETVIDLQHIQNQYISDLYLNEFVRDLSAYLTEDQRAQKNELLKALN